MMRTAPLRTGAMIGPEWQSCRRQSDPEPPHQQKHVMRQAPALQYALLPTRQAVPRESCCAEGALPLVRVQKVRAVCLLARSESGPLRHSCAAWAEARQPGSADAPQMMTSSSCATGSSPRLADAAVRGMRARDSAVAAADARRYETEGGRMLCPLTQPQPRPLTRGLLSPASALRPASAAPDLWAGGLPRPAPAHAGRPTACAQGCHHCCY